MIQFVLIVETIFIVIMVLYMALMILLTLKLKSSNNETTKRNDELVTVIIAFRDEQGNIKNLISSLGKQSHHNCQFIIVNDHSTDDSLQTAKLLTINASRFLILSLPDTLHGKKNAINYASQFATGNLVLFTDADCRFDKDWIASQVSFMVAEQLDFNSGAVFIQNPKTFIEKIQAVEIAHLIGIGHALISLKTPVLCNGANMGIRHKYLNAPLNENIASGDDIFRLQYAVKTKQQIGYNTQHESFIYTKAEPTIKGWIAQRSRWAGKSAHYSDKYSILLTLFIGMVQLTAVASIFCGDMKTIVYIWSIKLIAEILFITKVSQMYKQKFNLLTTLSLGICYPFLTIVVLANTIVGKIEWKGRKI